MGLYSVNWGLALETLPSKATVGKGTFSSYSTIISLFDLFVIDMGIWRFCGVLLPRALAPLAGGFILDAVKNAANTIAACILI